jgi:DNA-binding XRE family transcriptional regulator
MVTKMLFYPRHVSNMTQVEFARYCGVSKSIIYNIEKGIPVSKHTWLKILRSSVKLLEKDLTQRQKEG